MKDNYALKVIIRVLRALNCQENKSKDIYKMLCFHNCFVFICFI